MRQFAGLLWTSVVLVLAGVLFYITSVAGAFWPEASPPGDVGVYAVSIVLVGLGIGGLLLRAAKLHPLPE